MNAAETIAAAIEKLEQLKADSTPGVWEFVSDPFGAIFTEQEPGLGIETEVAEEMHDPDGHLIVTLHRTLEPQLAILRWWLPVLEGAPGHEPPADNPFMVLARAILGGVA